VPADFKTADVDLSVRFKPISGQVDQAAALVWRFQDENNDYIVRANARGRSRARDVDQGLAPFIIIE
jgi:hypothetical protein